VEIAPEAKRPIWAGQGVEVTRRLFLGLFLPTLGITQSAAESTQFVVSGVLTDAGADKHMAYYAIDQSLSLMLNPAYVPTMVQQADKLIGKRVRITLELA
jgi:hypothetical protein